MDHDTITATHAVERYLLDEMSAVEREQFEAHYFECEVCAEEVRSGSIFVANSRAVFEEDERAPTPAPEPVPPKRPWWAAVMRPVWGFALAGALAVFGVIRVAAPPSTAVHGVVQLTLEPGLKRGGTADSAAYQPGDTISLRLMIETAGAAGPHVLEIVDASGKEVAAVPVDLRASDAAAGKEVRFSGKNIPAGTYVAVLRAMKGDARGEVVDRYYFTLTPK